MVEGDVREWRKLASMFAASTGQVCLCWTGLLVISPKAHDGGKPSTEIITEDQGLTRRTRTPGWGADGWLVAKPRDT